ncbi:MAG: hypothetical protein KF774_16360 [Planctomyces sp.]|nr:hypothetical protein [Planctomyces sp.]
MTFSEHRRSRSALRAERVWLPPYQLAAGLLFLLGCSDSDAARRRLISDLRSGVVPSGAVVIIGESEESTAGSPIVESLTCVDWIEPKLFNRLLMFRELRRLILTKRPLSARDVAEIGRLEELDTLVLQHCRVEGRISELASSRKLRELDISHSQLEPCSDPSTSPVALETLNAGGSTLEDADIRWLTQSAPGLRKLRIGHCRVSLESCLRLKDFKNLEYLDCDTAPINASVVESLGLLRGLKELSLAGTDVSDDDLRPLMALTSLAVLRLDRCPNIDGSCLQFLQESPRLRFVTLSETRSPTTVLDRQ